MGRGLWRDGHWVLVSYEDREYIAISRTLYGARGYRPGFDDLPTREDYEARFPPSDGRAQIPAVDDSGPSQA